MYEHANPHNPEYQSAANKPVWLEIQDLAFHSDKASFDKLSKLVSDAERTSIRLPVIRTAVKNRDFVDKAGRNWSVKAGDTIILDIVRSPFRIFPRLTLALTTTSLFSTKPTSTPPPF